MLKKCHQALHFWPFLLYRVRMVSACRRDIDRGRPLGRGRQKRTRFLVETSAVRAAINRVPSRQRSRITNGSALLPNTDGRSAWVRRCKDIIAEQLADMGGSDNTSAAERSIVRRASVLTVELEQLEARFAQAPDVVAADLDVYQRGANSLRRLLEAVGIKRRQKNVTPPNPLDYAAAREDAA